MKKENILYATEVVQKRVTQIAEQINKDYKGLSIEIICLVNGGSVFCSDLIRQITIPMNLHQLAFTSYPEANPSGEVRVTLDIAQPMHNKHLLIIEGVIISGRTPKYIYDMLKLRSPASLEFCAIGVKTNAIAVDLPVKYSLFDFGSEIIVGYGIGTGSQKSLNYIAVQD